jgi:hypothetical protein
MILSPEDRQQLLGMAARQIVEEIRADIGDLSELVVLPLSAAAQLVGLSIRQVSRTLPVTRTAEGKHGVQLSALRAHIQSRTSKQ